MASILDAGAGTGEKGLACASRLLVKWPINDETMHLDVSNTSTLAGSAEVGTQHAERRTQNSPRLRALILTWRRINRSWFDGEGEEGGRGAGEHDEYVQRSTVRGGVRVPREAMDPSLFLCQSRRERSHHPPGIVIMRQQAVCWGFTVGGRGLAGTQRDEASSRDEGWNGGREKERAGGGGYDDGRSFGLGKIWRSPAPGMMLAWRMSDGGRRMTGNNLGSKVVAVAVAEETKRKTGF